jgi:rhodanese-related sulfurtransferase
MGGGANSAAGGAAYGGDVGARQTFDEMQQNPEAMLVDVRTAAEWSFVGVPRLPGSRQPLFVEWQVYPTMEKNAEFIAHLLQKGVTPGRPVYFLCRSGARSKAAAIAATAAGLGPAFNVADGFEGPANGEGHRGKTAGWKAAGLPWRQD